MAFLAKFKKTKTLSKIDLNYLSKLLDSNISVSEAFKLIENKKNSLILKEINYKLEKGLMIEEVIEEYLPKNIKEYLLSLVKKMTFKESLSLSLAFEEKMSSYEAELVKTVAYPSILLFVSMGALYLFDLYGLDMIFSLLKNFALDFGFFESLRVVFRILIRIIYSLFIVIVILFLIFLNHKRIVYLYIFMSKYFPDSLLAIYFSMEFIILFLLCLNKGYKTKETLMILKEMKRKPVISFLAYHLDEGLLEGESLNEAVKKKYYDSSLARFIKIGTSSNDFKNILNSYISFTDEKIKRKIKQYALTIEITTYLFIGSIVIFIYQILFLPMNAISSF